MTLLLRKQRARIEGWEPFEWPDDDYAIIDETKVGRIYKQHIRGELKWVWVCRLIRRRPQI